MTKLGNFLKGYRDTHDLSLRNFAALSGLSHTYIEKLEKGSDPRSGKPVVPTINTLQALAKATGKTLLEILQIAGYVSDVSTLKQRTTIKKISDVLTQDPELKVFWDEMVQRDDLQILLRQVKDLTPEAIRRLNKYIKIVEKEDHQDE